MAISLFDCSVTNYLQTVGAVIGFMDKGLAHCRERGIDPEKIVETRLYPDMLPFRFQIQCVKHHTTTAIEGMKAGVFRPPTGLTPLDYAGLQTLMAETERELRTVTPADVNGLEGGEVIFEAPNVRLPFTTEGFLFSFSLPNLHFHATTAYDILRSNGVPIGKRDYMGQVQLKG